MSQPEVAVVLLALWRLVPVDSVKIVNTDPVVWISSCVDSTVYPSKVGRGWGLKLVGAKELWVGQTSPCETGILSQRLVV